MQGWTDQFLNQGEKLISSLDELLAVCASGAARDNARDPAGVEWTVRRFDKALKPEFHYTLASPGFKIQRTYSLLLRPYAGRNYNRPEIVDTVFADVEPSRTCSTNIASFERLQIAEREWRRGYFGNKNWSQPPPERGETNSVMSRRADHLTRSIPEASLSLDWQNHWPEHWRDAVLVGSGAWATLLGRPLAPAPALRLQALAWMVIPTDASKAHRKNVAECAARPSNIPLQYTIQNLTSAPCPAPLRVTAKASS